MAVCSRPAFPPLSAAGDACSGSWTHPPRTNIHTDGGESRTKHKLSKSSGETLQKCWTAP